MPPSSTHPPDSRHDDDTLMKDAPNLTLNPEETIHDSQDFALQHRAPGSQDILSTSPSTEQCAQASSGLPDSTLTGTSPKRVPAHHPQHHNQSTPHANANVGNQLPVDTFRSLPQPPSNSAAVSVNSSLLSQSQDVRKPLQLSNPPATASANNDDAALVPMTD